MVFIIDKLSVSFFNKQDNVEKRLHTLGEKLAKYTRETFADASE